jgi:antitoxin component YwqK of YwqJK toxin-antitoxin module
MGLFDFLKKNKNIITDNGINYIFDNEGKGLLKEVFISKNGLKDGIFKSYYLNGEIILECNYVKDILHGDFKTYYQGGELESKKTYKNGLLNGLSVNYFENGNIKNETNYINDIPNGLHNKYNSLGKLIQSNLFINGLREKKGHSENSELITEIEYWNIENILSHKDYFIDNKIVYSIFKNEEKKHFFYYENGNKKFEICFREDKSYNKIKKNIDLEAISPSSISLIWNCGHQTYKQRFYPSGKWIHYSENGDKEYELDFTNHEKYISDLSHINKNYFNNNGYIKFSENLEIIHFNFNLLNNSKSNLEDILVTKKLIINKKEKNCSDGDIIQYKYRMMSLNGGIESYNFIKKIVPKEDRHILFSEIEIWSNDIFCIEIYCGSATFLGKSIKIYSLDNTKKVKCYDNLSAFEYFESGKSKYNKLNDYVGAMDDYNKSIELNPNFSEAFFNRGILNKVMENYQGALEDYNKAIELDEDSEAYRYRAGIKSTLKDFVGAMNDYNLAIEKHLNQRFITYFNRGCLKIELEDYKGAINDFEMSIDENINTDKRWPRSDFYKKRGDCKFKIGDYYGAIEDLNKVMELNPNCIEELKVEIEYIKKKIN